MLRIAVIKEESEDLEHQNITVMVSCFKLSINLLLVTETLHRVKLRKQSCCNIKLSTTLSVDASSFNKLFLLINFHLRGFLRLM